MSAWETYSTKKKDHKLEELIEEVEGDEMPLESYAWIHGKLSKKDQEKLIQWANLARIKYQDELKVSYK
jgi:outer membrane biogenesis lipoprotein LolB